MTLPTIHPNGTSRKMLCEGYDKAAERLHDFLDAWGDTEFNARDYYVNGPDSWSAAVDERLEINKKISDIHNYIQKIREHIHA